MSKSKLTISLDPDVLSDCKVRAAKIDLSLSEYIQELIRNDIKNNPDIQYESIIIEKNNTKPSEEKPPRRKIKFKRSENSNDNT